MRTWVLALLLLFTTQVFANNILGYWSGKGSFAGQFFDLNYDCEQAEMYLEFLPHKNNLHFALTANCNSQMVGDYLTSKVIIGDDDTSLFLKMENGKTQRVGFITEDNFLISIRNPPTSKTEIIHIEGRISGDTLRVYARYDIDYQFYGKFVVELEKTHDHVPKSNSSSSSPDRT